MIIEGRGREAEFAGLYGMTEDNQILLCRKNGILFYQSSKIAEENYRHLNKMSWNYSQRRTRSNLCPTPRSIVVHSVV